MKQDKYHSYDLDDVRNYGMTEAIILNFIRRWLKSNRKHGKATVNGRVWMFQTLDQLADELFYIARSTIHRKLKKLIEAGAIVVECLNPHSYDRKRWYSMPGFEVAEPSQDEIPLSQNGTSKSHSGTTIERSCFKDLDPSIKGSIDFSVWPEQPDPKLLAQWEQIRAKAGESWSEWFVSKHLRREFEKAHQNGVSVNQCLALAIKQGWKSFYWSNYQRVVTHHQVKRANLAEQSRKKAQARQAAAQGSVMGSGKHGTIELASRTESLPYRPNSIQELFERHHQEALA